MGFGYYHFEWDGRVYGIRDPLPPDFDFKRARPVYVEYDSLSGDAQPQRPKTKTEYREPRQRTHSRQRRSFHQAAREINSQTRHYRALGLTVTATIDEVKSAYRRLAKTFHPDVNPAGNERMKEINAAYAAIMGY